MATDLTARIVSLPFREGDSFPAGATLVAFDCDKAQAELRAAEAEDQVNRIAYDNAKALDRRKEIGRIEVQAAKAKWDKAQSAAEALRVRVRDCRIVAPFAGRVAELKAHEFEIPSPGQPFLCIVDADALESTSSPPPRGSAGCAPARPCRCAWTRPAAPIRPR